jgi:phage tail protein X
VDVAASGDLEPLISARERVATRALAKLEVSARLPSLAANYSPQVEFHPADPRSALLEPPDSSPAIVEWPDPSRQPRRYRIGKHDTLEAIAERLLGSRQHADKLLAANPGVILVPEILPVGATIVIPDIDQATETLVRVPQPRD